MVQYTGGGGVRSLALTDRRVNRIRSLLLGRRAATGDPRTNQTQQNNSCPSLHLRRCSPLLHCSPLSSRPAWPTDMRTPFKVTTGRRTAISRGAGRV